MLKLAILILRQMISTGQLRISLPGSPDLVFQPRSIDGHDNGNSSAGPKIAISVADRKALLVMALRPDPYIGELYMKGDLKLIKGDLEEFMQFLFENGQNWQKTLLGRTIYFCHRLLNYILAFNQISTSKRNVAHHYDLGDQLFHLFLDRQQQYSCAYFKSDKDDLHTAQQQKIARLAAKLFLQPNQRILDIGCGWGGLAMALGKYAPKNRITGITLSENQYQHFQKNIQKQNLKSHLSVQLRDYRQLGDQQFDRIISVGMLEHVGKRNLSCFLQAVERHLHHDGVAVLHGIGRFGPAQPTSSWLKKYIFPGGYLPSLSEMMNAVETTSLKITDVEILRLHYAKTLRHWRDSFEKNKADLPATYDEKFMRMWRFYLLSCENYFRYQRGMVFQIQLVKQQTVLPLTRDYIASDAQNYLDDLCQSPPFGNTPP